MRRLSEDAGSFPWADERTDRDAMARVAGHPRWLVDLFFADLGEEAGAEILACGMEPAPTYVRLNPFEAQTVETILRLQAAHPRQSPPDPDCYELERPAAAFRGDATRLGWFAMDAAAQMAPLAADPRERQDVLDIGAGRGNKTICLQAHATRAGGAAAIVAVDVHASKVAALQERMGGVPGVTALQGDALDLASAFGDRRFDVVLLDAPCSGLGTLRRYPEKRWRVDPGLPARMAALQLSMLAAASGVVRSGGRVVYSTCSVARVENDDVVDAFLASAAGNDFELVPLERVPAEWARFGTTRGCFQSWPTPGGPDGHYVAALRRVDG
jgi:16S rRNA (cytosine967-C5)-methyltransferase